MAHTLPLTVFPEQDTIVTKRLTVEEFAKKFVPKSLNDVYRYQMASVHIGKLHFKILEPHTVLFKYANEVTLSTHPTTISVGDNSSFTIHTPTISPTEFNDILNSRRNVHTGLVYRTVNIQPILLLDLTAPATKESLILTLTDYILYTSNGLAKQLRQGQSIPPNSTLGYFTSNPKTFLEFKNNTENSVESILLHRIVEKDSGAIVYYLVHLLRFLFGFGCSPIVQILSLGEFMLLFKKTVTPSSKVAKIISQTVEALDYEGILQAFHDRGIFFFSQRDPSARLSAKQFRAMSTMPESNPFEIETYFYAEAQENMHGELNMKGEFIRGNSMVRRAVLEQNCSSASRQMGSRVFSIKSSVI